MASYLITGASRGIGLAFVEELLNNPENFVIASARNPHGSTRLQALATQYPRDRLVLMVLDYADTASVDRAAEQANELLPDGLDYLISNAGVHMQAFATLDTIDLNIFEEELRINTIAPVHVLRTFLKLIREGSAKKVVFITSNLGSMAAAPILSTVGFTYSASKAALNVLARKWGAILSDEGIAVVVIHPGWVDTEMGTKIDENWVAENFPGASKISARECATGCIKVMTEAGPEKDIRFYASDGSELPW
ncbi:NAD(P)-binding protein [Wolfiporia cocos MD-104 SS10]|uniref:NAD(P)-binding protein n=1 Tax=Wolfiporia cocos (strain MD-104) TaxID=742152 RepID=A0A2H3J8Q2_WOLCO|nr:NAD(P)-binding protein [Wolfiporia cocos MD-104 SS10]